jgi:hypothetical protein
MIFDFIGEQTVKNLTDPIRVYRVRFLTGNHHIRNSLVRRRCRPVRAIA